MRKMNFVAACVILVPAISHAGEPAGTAALRASSSAPVAITTRDADSKARFVRTDGDLVPSISTADRPAKAQAFFRRHGAVLGLDRTSDLQLKRTLTDDWGNTTVVYSQQYNGVPVFGAWANANFKSDGHLTTVNGDIVSNLDLATQPTVPGLRAEQDALRHVASTRPVAGLKAQRAQLYVYRLNGNSNRQGTPVLAWQVEVGNGRDVREFVFVDAQSGKIVDQFNGIQDALDRRIYDGGYGAPFLVWTEGQPTPVGVPSIDNLIDYTADTYYFFSNLTSGAYLSWTGTDDLMEAVNNDPAINCPNANWNGLSINFCDGTSSDDVVGHEWAHAYTQATHGLIYRWQSGALNESYSDIFGETIDFLNGAGTDTQVGVRSVGACSTFGGSLPPIFTVLSPAAISGEYSTQGAAFNPSTANVVGADLVLVDDNADVSATDGCQAIVNDVSGAIALIDRGNCTFVTKVINAQNAGAEGVVIANNAGDDLVNMGGSPAGIFIPSVFVGQTDGQTLRNAGQTPTASIVIGGSAEASRRWLMGEDATAFGGHIRDMWEPRCMGDPGKVSDGQYLCSGDIDNGGVHINSGIPNHAFALLIDGGTFNGVTVDSIGLDKAAQIYWRAATNYQGPTSDFFDHANALELACADLTDLTLPAVSTEIGGAGNGSPITAADCDAVAAAMEAVEMRAVPVQCNFQLLLEQDPPALCDPGMSPQSIFSEDFESGLGGWTVGRNVVNPATFSGPDWSVTDVNLPEAHPGSAAYGPNLVLGNCATDIEAGVIYLQSPIIALPAETAPKIAFDHNVATEANYDGGNLKISVNGGPYTLVPAAAFIYNAYNGSLFAGDNPMTGEPAFNGTDDGSLSSTWGQSQIDLTGIASPGDNVQLRFDLGMDGCNGLVGWYVDDISVYTCAAGGIDSDFDGVTDDVDNCTDVANADQFDSNGDNIGNVCDADITGPGGVEDCIVNFLDLQDVKDAFFSNPASPAWNPHADFDNSGQINFADLQTLKGQIFGPPGPSAAGCN